MISFNDIKFYIKTHFNKHYLKFLKTALSGYAYDSCFLLELEKAKLEEMVADFEYCRDKSGWSYEGIEHDIRDMKLAISLLDIILHEEKFFHFDHITDENGKPMQPKYVSDVKVNYRNAYRFMSSKEIEYYEPKQSHELYIQKARYLYHKLRLYREQYWWN